MKEFWVITDSTDAPIAVCNSLSNAIYRMETLIREIEFYNGEHDDEVAKLHNGAVRCYMYNIGVLYTTYFKAYRTKFYGGEDYDN